MTDFDARYVNTNIRAGAPPLNPQLLQKLYQKITTEAPEVKPIAYPLLAAVAIGAHRPDIPPKLFETAIAGLESEDAIKAVLYQFRSVIMIIWPFVGIPWCVPVVLGLVNILQARGIEHIALGRTRPDINIEVDQAEGAVFRQRVYQAVANKEVQEMLHTYFADFSSLGWTVVFGYSLAGTAKTGVFRDFETQLILSVAVAASGATRQARSHGQGAIGIGNSVVAVKVLFAVAEELNAWNGTPLASIDVDILARQAKEVLAGSEAASMSKGTT